MRESKKSLWRRLDEKAGFYHDERTAYIQLQGVRRSYWLTIVLLPSVAALQQFVNGQTGVLWVMLTAVCLTLFFLALRQHQLGLADERAQHIHLTNYRHAYLFLILALAIALTALFLQTPNHAVPGLFLWPPTILLTLLPLFSTHIRQQSYPTRTWLIVGAVGSLAVLLGYLAGRGALP